MRIVVRELQLSDGSSLKHRVVEVDELGNVLAHYPFTQELPHTTYLPGVYTITRAKKLQKQEPVCP